MAKKHLLVVSQYFYPEQFRINDICEEWIEKGYDVTVLTGIPNYPIGKFFSGYSVHKKRYEVYKGIEIIRIPIFARGNRSFRLMLNYLSFVFSGVFWSIFTKKKVDAVFTYGVSPIIQAIPSIVYAKKNNVPHYIYIMDIWPDSISVVLGIKNQIILKPISKIIDYIYAQSKIIFTSSKSFIEDISRRGVRKDKLIYWPQYAEDFYVPKIINKYNFLNEKLLNITFAGNIGKAQGLDILIDVVIKLKNIGIDNVMFNIIGEGSNKKVLLEKIENENIGNYFNFINRQLAENIPNYFAESDVALITLTKNEIFSRTIPAKLQSTMACAMPLLISANGEINQIVKEANCGFVSEAEDVEGLFSNILSLINLNEHELKLLGANARLYYNDNFAKEKLLNDMNSYLWRDYDVYK